MRTSEFGAEAERSYFVFAIGACLPAMFLNFFGIISSTYSGAKSLKGSESLHLMTRTGDLEIRSVSGRLRDNPRELARMHVNYLGSRGI